MISSHTRPKALEDIPWSPGPRAQHTEHYSGYFNNHYPYVFKNSATKAMSYVQTARDIASSFSSFSTSGSATTSTTSASRSTITAPPASASSSSSWASWAIPAAVGLGGILVSGAAAGAAYYKRKDIGEGYQWATDHMKYVGTLWNQKKLKERLENLITTEKNLKVTFRK